MTVLSKKVQSWILFLAATAAIAVVLAGCAGVKPRKGTTPAPAPHRSAHLPARKPPLPGSPAQSPVTPGAEREKPIAPDRIVRVLVAGPVKSVSTDGCPVRVWKEDGALAAEWNGSVVVAADGKRIRAGGMHVDGSIDVGSDAAFSVAGRRMPAGRVHIMNRQGSLLVVAALPLEEYVAAVLSREGSASFQPAALAALAVAVRTYAVNAAARPRDPSYDLRNGVDDQVFDGFDRVSPQFRAAAAETRGVLLWHGDALARVNYHSTCGGRTESAAAAWGKPVPYLVSIPCDDCRESPAYRWEYRMTLDEAKRVAQALGLRARDDLRIEVVSKSPAGRASRILLSSSGVTRETGAAAFRQAAGNTKVKSLLIEIERAGDGWKITGNGYGHGVGLCQWGADGMARRGRDYKEILAHYFPGTRLSGGAP